MNKNITKFGMTLIGVFQLTQVLATEIYPFYIERRDGTVLEGYFSPPSTRDSPIVFAIQGSSCESTLPWHKSLSDQAKTLGLGVIALEKQGISNAGIDLFTYSQTNCIQNRLEDYVLCLENAHLICPGWEGNPIFWGESEGGMLAAALASQTPQTAAVLLFATGGGIKPCEEVKWAVRHRLEKHGALQDEIDQYMSFWDQQMDVMKLDPTPEKQFLGNTYKWWASLIVSEEAAMPLNQQAFPICLIHGVEDSQIPIYSADLAAENLAKTNVLNYLRLEGYGHDLDTPDVRDAACYWLASVLFGQEFLSDRIMTTIAHSAPASFVDWKTDISHYVLCRGKGEVYVDWKTDISHYVLCRGKGEVYIDAKGRKDSDGNKSASGSVGASKEFDNGVKVDVKGEASIKKESNGDTKGEVNVEGRISKGF